jgi:hypothetical protein
MMQAWAAHEHCVDLLRSLDFIIPAAADGARRADRRLVLPELLAQTHVSSKRYLDKHDERSLFVLLNSG